LSYAREVPLETCRSVEASPVAYRLRGHVRSHCGSLRAAPYAVAGIVAAGEAAETVGYGLGDRDVAQLGSAPALGAGGPGFKSRHPD
jgi:hypothetical protein